MRVYGSRRHDTLSCYYGCCGFGLARSLKHRGSAKARRKGAKHRARREARAEAWEQYDALVSKDEKV